MSYDDGSINPLSVCTLTNHEFSSFNIRIEVKNKNLASRNKAIIIPFWNKISLFNILQNAAYNTKLKSNDKNQLQSFLD